MKEIIKLTKDLLENVDQFDDWIDHHIEEIKDYTDTVSDVIAPVKSVVSIMKLVKTRKFKKFLKSYAEEIQKKQGKLSEGYTGKLKEYLSKPINRNMVYESIEAAINSNSIYCTNCIGYIAGQQMANLYEVNNKVLILINAFKNLNDFELFSAVKILKSVKDYTEPQLIRELNIISRGTVSEYTVQKLKNLQIIETSENTLSRYSQPMDSNSFFMSDITEEFMEIIEDSGTHSMMDKDFT